MKKETDNAIAVIQNTGEWDTTQYLDIDLNRLAVFALDKLEKMHIPFTFERFSILLFKLFPKKFSLKEFSTYPDLSRIERTLLQLRPKYRNWAIGNKQQGVKLTLEGQDALIQVTKLLNRGKDELVSDEFSFGGKRRSVEPTDGRRDRGLRFMAEIENSDLYAAYSGGIIPEDFIWMYYKLLHASERTDEKTLNDNLATLRSFADSLEKEDVQKFLDWAEHLYRDTKKREE